MDIVGATGWHMQGSLAAMLDVDEEEEEAAAIIVTGGVGDAYGAERRQQTQGSVSRFSNRRKEDARESRFKASANDSDCWTGRSFRCSVPSVPSVVMMPIVQSPLASHWRQLQADTTM